MPKKILKGTYPEKCIGCELCVFAAQRLQEKIGIGSSPIKILGTEKKFSIHLDPTVQHLDIKKIADICPKSCYTIEESSAEEILEFKMEEDESSE